MKNILMMAVLALALTSTAHAGYYSVLETCISFDPTPDHSLTVTIETYHGSRVAAAADDVSTIAIITDETVANPQQLGSYEVIYKAPAPHIVGTRGAYVGTDFNLSFPLVPSQSEGAIADLSAVSNTTSDKSEINDTVTCIGSL
jgi:hypothetical protein